MVTATRWSEITQSLSQPLPRPPRRDPWPVWGSLVVAGAIFWSGFWLGAGIAAGWKLVEWSVR